MNQNSSKTTTASSSLGTTTLLSWSFVVRYDNDSASDVTVNGSLPVEHHLSEDKLFQAVYLSYLWTALIIGLPGNLLIAIVYIAVKQKRTSDWFIFFLSVYDCAVCVFAVPLYLSIETGAWITTGSDLACKIEQFTIFTSQFSSVSILGIIAVDRYLKICHPTKRSLNAMQARNLGMCTPVVSALVAAPILVWNGNVEHRYCRIQERYKDTLGVKIHLCSTFGFFVCIFFVVIFCYTHVCVVVRRRIQRHMENSLRRKHLMQIPAFLQAISNVDDGQSSRGDQRSKKRFSLFSIGSSRRLSAITPWVKARLSLPSENAGRKLLRPPSELELATKESLAESKKRFDHALIFRGSVGSIEDSLNGKREGTLRGKMEELKDRLLRECEGGEELEDLTQKLSSADKAVGEEGVADAGNDTCSNAGPLGRGDTDTFKNIPSLPGANSPMYHEIKLHNVNGARHIWEGNKVLRNDHRHNSHIGFTTLDHVVAVHREDTDSGNNSEGEESHKLLQDDHRNNCNVGLHYADYVVDIHEEDTDKGNNFEEVTIHIEDTGRGNTSEGHECHKLLQNNQNSNIESYMSDHVMVNPVVDMNRGNTSKEAKGHRFLGLRADKMKLYLGNDKVKAGEVTSLLSGFDSIDSTSTSHVTCSTQSPNKDQIASKDNSAKAGKAFIFSKENVNCRKATEDEVELLNDLSASAMTSLGCNCNIDSSGDNGNCCEMPYPKARLAQNILRASCPSLHASSRTSLLTNEKSCKRHRSSSERNRHKHKRADFEDVVPDSKIVKIDLSRIHDTKSCSLGFSEDACRKTNLSANSSRDGSHTMERESEPVASSACFDYSNQMSCLCKQKNMGRTTRSENDDMNEDVKDLSLCDDDDGDDDDDGVKFNARNALLRVDRQRNFDDLARVMAQDVMDSKNKLEPSCRVLCFGTHELSSESSKGDRPQPGKDANPPNDEPFQTLQDRDNTTSSSSSSDFKNADEIDINQPNALSLVFSCNKDGDAALSNFDLRATALRGNGCLTYDNINIDVGRTTETNALKNHVGSDLGRRFTDCKCSQVVQKNRPTTVAFSRKETPFSRHLLETSPGADGENGDFKSVPNNSTGLIQQRRDGIMPGSCHVIDEKITCSDWTGEALERNAQLPLIFKTCGHENDTETSSFFQCQDRKNSCICRSQNIRVSSPNDDTFCSNYSSLGNQCKILQTPHGAPESIQNITGGHTHNNTVFILESQQKGQVTEHDKKSRSQSLLSQTNRCESSPKQKEGEFVSTSTESKDSGSEHCAVSELNYHGIDQMRRCDSTDCLESQQTAANRSVINSNRQGSRYLKCRDKSNHVAKSSITKSQFSMPQKSAEDSNVTGSRESTEGERKPTKHSFWKVNIVKEANFPLTNSPLLKRPACPRIDDDFCATCPTADNECLKIVTDEKYSSARKQGCRGGTWPLSDSTPVNGDVSTTRRNCSSAWSLPDSILANGDNSRTRRNFSQHGNVISPYQSKLRRRNCTYGSGSIRMASSDTNLSHHPPREQNQRQQAPGQVDLLARGHDCASYFSGGNNLYIGLSFLGQERTACGRLDSAEDRKVQTLPKKTISEGLTPSRGKDPSCSSLFCNECLLLNLSVMLPRRNLDLIKDIPALLNVNNVLCSFSTLDSGIRHCFKTSKTSHRVPAPTLNSILNKTSRQQLFMSPLSHGVQAQMSCLVSPRITPSGRTNSRETCDQFQNEACVPGDRVINFHSLPCHHMHTSPRVTTCNAFLDSSSDLFALTSLPREVWKPRSCLISNEILEQSLTPITELSVRSLNDYLSYGLGDSFHGSNSIDRSSYVFSDYFDGSDSFDLNDYPSLRSNIDFDGSDNIDSHGSFLKENGQNYICNFCLKQFCLSLPQMPRCDNEYLGKWETSDVIIETSTAGNEPDWPSSESVFNSQLPALPYDCIDPCNFKDILDKVSLPWNACIFCHGNRPDMQSGLQDLGLVTESNLPGNEYQAKDANREVEISAAANQLPGSNCIRFAKIMSSTNNSASYTDDVTLALSENNSAKSVLSENKNADPVTCSVDCINEKNSLREGNLLIESKVTECVDNETIFREQGQEGRCQLGHGFQTGNWELKEEITVDTPTLPAAREVKPVRLFLANEGIDFGNPRDQIGDAHAEPFNTSLNKRKDGSTLICGSANNIINSALHAMIPLAITSHSSARETSLLKGHMASWDMIKSGACKPTCNTRHQSSNPRTSSGIGQKNSVGVASSSSDQRNSLSVASSGSGQRNSVSAISFEATKAIHSTLLGCLPTLHPADASEATKSKCISSKIANSETCEYFVRSVFDSLFSKTSSSYASEPCLHISKEEDIGLDTLDLPVSSLLYADRPKRAGCQPKDVAGKDLPIYHIVEQNREALNSAFYMYETHMRKMRSSCKYGSSQSWFSLDDLDSSRKPSRFRHTSMVFLSSLRQQLHHVLSPKTIRQFFRLNEPRKQGTRDRLTTNQINVIITRCESLVMERRQEMGLPPMRDRATSLDPASLDNATGDSTESLYSSPSARSKYEGSPKPRASSLDTSYSSKSRSDEQSYLSKSQDTSFDRSRGASVDLLSPASASIRTGSMCSGMSSLSRLTECSAYTEHSRSDCEKITRRSAEREHNITKLLGVITLLFVISWSVSWSVILVDTLMVLPVNDLLTTNVTLSIARNLFLVNHFCNIVVYAVLSESFRDKLAQCYKNIVVCSPHRTL